MVDKLQIIVNCYTGHWVLTYSCHITLPIMKSIFYILHHFKSFSPLLNRWVGSIELKNLRLGIQNEHIIMIECGPSKKNLIIWNRRGNSKEKNGPSKMLQLSQLKIRRASFTRTLCFPLQTYKRVSWFLSFTSACLNPEAIPPCWGIIHGLK